MKEEYIIRGVEDSIDFDRKVYQNSRIRSDIVFVESHHKYPHPSLSFGVYHINETTVLIRTFNNEEVRIEMVGKKSKINKAKSLLEEITKIKLK